MGFNVHNGELREVRLGISERLRHTHVIGASGTGKSMLLLNLILQDIGRGGGIALLDPHGDLADAVLGRIPESRIEDVIVFDPADEEFSVGFNILKAHNDLEKNLLSSDLVAVFKRVSTTWGDQMSSVLGNAILAFLESDRGGTLIDLRRFFYEQLRDFLLSPDDITAHLKQVDTTISQKEELVVALTRELEKVSAEMDFVYRLYVEKQISPEGFGKRNRPLEERAKQIEEEVPRLQAEIDLLKITLLSSDENLNLARDLYRQWPSLSFGRQDNLTGRLSR